VAAEGGGRREEEEHPNPRDDPSLLSARARARADNNGDNGDQREGWGRGWEGRGSRGKPGRIVAEIARSERNAIARAVTPRSIS